MSLINQVLRDLDRRSGAVAAPLPGAVQATTVLIAPPPLQRRRRHAAAAIGGSLCVAAAAWLAAQPARVAVPAVAEAAPLAVAQTSAVPVAAAPDVATAPLMPSAPAAGPADEASPAVPPPATPPPRRRVRAPQAGPVPRVTTPVALRPAPPVPTPRTASAGTEAPVRADAAYRQGMAAYERGDPSEAARAYAAALQQDAALAPARVGLAGLLIAQGRLGEAETLLQAGLALAPQQPLVAQPLARLQADRGDLAAAIDVMQTALAGGTGSADDRACLAALLQRAGREREAAEHFSAALRLQPGNGVWWMGLAMSLAAQGHGDAARTAYARARSSGNLSPELLHFVELRMREPL